MKDLLIVGSGPAGISAALTAAARGLDFLWFGSRSLSPKISKAPEIANYPGLCRISGRDFCRLLQQQIDTMGLPLREERIDSIFAMGDSFTACVNETMYEARAVILAVGVSAAGAVPGELDYVGQGVSYCATCDGALYRGKTIAIVSTKAAAKAAGAHDFITRLPNGYDTQVGSAGARLSGGQRQRIAIARALLVQPEYLLLDEATASLDHRTTDAVLDSLLNGRVPTVLYISHNMNEVRRADHVIVLQDGRVEASGTPEELPRISPTYREYAAKQRVEVSV